MRQLIYEAQRLFNMCWLDAQRRRCALYCAYDSEGNRRWWEAAHYMQSYAAATDVLWALLLDGEQAQFPPPE